MSAEADKNVKSVHHSSVDADAFPFLLKQV